MFREKVGSGTDHISHLGHKSTETPGPEKNTKAETKGLFRLSSRTLVLLFEKNPNNFLNEPFSENNYFAAKVKHST